MPYPCCCDQQGQPVCVNKQPAIPVNDLVAYVTTRWEGSTTGQFLELFGDPFPCAKSTYSNYATDGVYWATNVVLGPDANETDLLCRGFWPSDLDDLGYPFPGPHAFEGPVSWYNITSSPGGLGAVWCSDASAPTFEDTPLFLRAYGIEFRFCNLTGLFAYWRRFGSNIISTRYLGYFPWPQFNGNYQTGVEYVFDQWDPNYDASSPLQVAKFARDYLSYASVRFEYA